MLGGCCVFECVHETRLPALVGQTSIGYDRSERTVRLVLTAQVACWFVWDVYSHDIHRDKVLRWGQQITSDLGNLTLLSARLLGQTSKSP